MEFPKPLMNIKSLTELGFSEKQLREIARTKGYPIAIRTNTKKTAQILFDTKELDAYLKRTSRMMERR